MKFHGKNLKALPDPEKTEQELDNLIEHPEKSSSIKLIKKFLIFSPILLLLLVIAYSSPLSDYFTQVSELSSKIRDIGITAPIVFTLGIAVLVSIGFPRLIFCPIAGMAFGFVFGLLYTIVGSLIAYYLFFIFVRRNGRQFQFKYVEEHKKIGEIIKKGGIPAVILARQVPVHGMVVNIILALSPIRHMDFLVGTAIGLVPEAAACTLLGSSTAQGSLHKSITYLAVAMVLLAILWLGLIVYTNHARKKSS